MAQCQRLGDAAANREAEHVDRGETERPDERRTVVGHRLDRGRRLTARARHTRIVEEDYLAPRCEAVGDERVPMVQPAAEVLEEHQGRADRLAEAAVGEADAVGFDQLGRNRLVGPTRRRGPGGRTRHDRLLGLRVGYAVGASGMGRRSRELPGVPHDQCDRGDSQDEHHPEPGVLFVHEGGRAPAGRVVELTRRRPVVGR